MQNCSGTSRRKRTSATSVVLATQPSPDMSSWKPSSIGAAKITKMASSTSAASQQLLSGWSERNGKAGRTSTSLEPPKPLRGGFSAADILSRSEARPTSAPAARPTADPKELCRAREGVLENDREGVLENEASDDSNRRSTIGDGMRPCSGWTL